MGKKHMAILIVIEDECVNEAIWVGIQLAQAGYTNVYQYRDGIKVATRDELPEDDDHTEYMLTSRYDCVSKQIHGLGLCADECIGTVSVVSTDDSAFDIIQVYTISR